MLGGEDNTECLSVTTGVTHKLAVETTDIVLGRGITERTKDRIVEELGIIPQRCLAKFRLYLVYLGSVFDDRELRKQFVAFGIGGYIGTVEIGLYGVVYLLPVGVYRVAIE